MLQCLLHLVIQNMPDGMHKFILVVVRVKFLKNCAEVGAQDVAIHEWQLFY